jgi:uncharacterized phage infection (PIP) family protein YhgE
MRRLVFLILGLLELAIAGVVVLLGCELPDDAEIERAFSRAERVTDHTGGQVRILRRQVQELRRPELQQLAERMRQQTAAVTSTMRNERIDFDSVRAMREALGKTASGLDELARTLSPDSVRQLGTSLEEAADSLDEKGAVAAEAGRDTEKLREIAGALRQVRKGIDTTAARWPELRQGLERSAGLLRTARDQLDRAVKNRANYNAALQQTVRLAETVSTMLPLLTDQLDRRLDEEESALDDLGQSLEEVQASIPAYARTAQNLLRTGRLLAWLVAAAVALHGSYLMLSVRLGRPHSV